MDTQSTGFVIWLTGMQRAGKSTLAKLVANRLSASGRAAELLDEDGDAKALLEGLTDSREDHARVVRRLGFVAKAVSRSGGVAVCAALSPWRDVRDQLRKEARRFAEVFVDCSMEKLMERDPQGTYKRALAGEAKNVPGVDIPYEPPQRAEITVRTDQDSVEQCVLKIFQGLVDAKLIGPAEFGRLTGGQRPRRGKPAKAKAARAKAGKKGAARPKKRK
ncbi:MAG TPA: adenylyl-sulfate kinase [Anaeromyxobacteraceae bacterium]|nr:adenylyl-sulfate kinase [Anaeromyxobacteraceae bacterium]